MTSKNIESKKKKMLVLLQRYSVEMYFFLVA